jgi:hypothetical protein
MLRSELTAGNPKRRQHEIGIMNDTNPMVPHSKPEDAKNFDLE